MKKNISLLLTAGLLCMGKAMAANVLTVGNVIVPQGGQATIEIGCWFDIEFTAFELQLSLPDGLTLVTDEDGKPIIERGFEGSHAISGNLLPSNGNYQFTCYSTNKDDLSMPASGTLFKVTVKADASLATGTMLTAGIVASEFTRTADSMGEYLDDVEFTITITELRTLLDENATEPPVAEEGADVRVRRTFVADEWTTICLPFAMTETQTKEAFGEGVMLADFTRWTSEEDEEGDIMRLNLYFETVRQMEANHPYMINVMEDMAEFTVDGVNVNPEEEPAVQVGKKKADRGYMIGSYTVSAVPESDIAISDGRFAYSDGTMQTKAFRAWFELADELTDKNNCDVRLYIDDRETSVRDLHLRMPDGTVYDLAGRRIAKTGEGIYIIDGRKQVVR